MTLSSKGLALALPACMLWACAPGLPFGLNIDGAGSMRSPNDTLLRNAAQIDYEDPADLGLTGPEAARYRRNFIVGQYLTQSDQLCGEYLQILTRVQRDYSLTFGSLATILGGLGAIFTHASVARPLAGAAGMASAERAEIDADTFARQTSQVVIAGINNSRARTYNNIVQINFNRSVAEWPLSVALADVQDYHLRCSLHEGIMEATASINATAPTGNALPQPAGAPPGLVGRAETPPSLGTISTNATVGAAVGAGQAGASGDAVAAAARGAATGASTGAAPSAGAPVTLLPSGTTTAPPRRVPPPSQIPVRDSKCTDANVAAEVANGKKDLAQTIRKLNDAQLKAWMDALAMTPVLKDLLTQQEIARILAISPGKPERAQTELIVKIQKSVCTKDELGEVLAKVPPA